MYVSASRPELALSMYEDADKWTEALKLAQMHLPHRVAEVNIGMCLKGVNLIQRMMIVMVLTLLSADE